MDSVYVGPTAMNREAWLTALGQAIAPLFPRRTLTRPWRITCGWPSTHGLGVRARRVGECHSMESSTGRVHEIFISPVLDDPLEVAGTVAHELAHVAAGIKAGHGKAFVALCRRVGLTSGQPKSVMPGPLLMDKLRGIVAGMEPYPHRRIEPTVKTKAGAGAASVRLACTNDECGCRLSIASRWIDEVPALPTCGCGAPFRKACRT